MVAPFPAARPFRPAGALPRSSSTISENTATLETPLIELRKTLPTFGARRLIREFDLPISHGALERIWREHGLMKKRRRKYQRKQDLATSKRSGRCFSKSARIPRISTIFPTTGRRPGDRPAGCAVHRARSAQRALFWAFASRRSAAASAVFASRVQQHLHRYGVSLRDLVWQTDNGGEFKGDFPKALGASQHVRIPPAAHTYQSDVETVHRIEEDEFFDLDRSPAGEIPRQGPHLPALLQPRQNQLPQGKSNSLADHRAPRSSLTPRTLLASTVSGLLPQ